METLGGHHPLLDHSMSEGFGDLPDIDIDKDEEESAPAEMRPPVGYSSCLLHCFQPYRWRPIPLQYLLTSTSRWLATVVQIYIAFSVGRAPFREHLGHLSWTLVHLKEVGAQELLR
jgi:hypothetical protein